MTKAKWALGASILIFLAAGTVPAMAADAPDRDFSAPSQTVPEILSAKQKQFYTQVLTAIRGQRWADAKSMLDGADKGPLNDFLRAELLGEQLPFATALSIQLAILIGAVTLTGSIVAFAKLQELMEEYR